jgi:hypothetical protein
MEILLIIVGIIFIWWLISSWIDRWKEKERDRAANEILSNKDNKRIIIETATLVSRFDDTSKKIMDNISSGYFVDSKFSEIDIGVDCPKCSSGSLSLRRGMYGEFYGCSRYPACNYTKSLATTIKNKDNFWLDIKRAYFK